MNVIKASSIVGVVAALNRVRTSHGKQLRLLGYQLEATDEGYNLWQAWQVLGDQSYLACIYIERHSHGEYAIERHTEEDCLFDYECPLSLLAATVCVSEEWRQHVVVSCSMHNFKSFICSFCEYAYRVTPESLAEILKCGESDVVLGKLRMLWDLMYQEEQANRGQLDTSAELEAGLNILPDELFSPAECVVQTDDLIEDLIS